ncbi:MAG: hypothetical protein OK456_08720 [Thaumarchaeota archaeon]|nr:hypothetical protein [Nitrososphaerota archaeon]
MFQLPQTSRLAALSLVALMFLAGGMIRPASAIVVVNPAPNFTLTGTPALIGPIQAVVHGGDLWVSDFGAGAIYAYPSPYTANEAPIITLTATGVGDLAFDSSGNLWAGGFAASGGHVLEFDAPITNHEAASVNLNGFAEPSGVAVNQGNLWVFDGNGNVYEYSPEPTMNMGPNAPILTGLANTYVGAFDSNNNLWLVNLMGDTVSEYASPVFLGETSSLTLSVPHEPTTLAFDGAGNLWVGEGSANSGIVDKFSAPITNMEVGTSEVTISTTNSIWGISVDSSSNLWVTDFSDGLVYEFTGLASGAPSVPVSLPPVIAKNLVFQFSGKGGTVKGNLVGVEGGGIVYNLPGYTATPGVWVYTTSICFVASQDAIQISGFSYYQAGFNSSEIFVSGYASSLTNAQGWPTEPACAS